MIPLQDSATTQKAPLQKKNWQSKVQSAGFIFLCLSCFFLPLSPSMIALFSVLVIISWAISGCYRTLPITLKNYPVSVISFALFFLIIAASSYSPATLDEALYTMKKYREFLLFPMIISFCSVTGSFCKKAENCFLGGCITLMLISYAIFFNIIPEDRYGHSIVFHITHNFFMAVLSYWAVHKTISSSRYRLFWILIGVLSISNLFYISPGRTGMLIFICLIPLVIFQHCRFRWVAILMLLFVSCLTFFFFTSKNLNIRVQQVIQEIRHYEPGQSKTSIGQRFDWWRTSIDLITEKPLIGYGTGSYKTVLNNHQTKGHITETKNPHNEYLFITVQFGILGLFLFLAMMVSLWIQARKLSPDRRYLLQGVIVAMLSGCLMNSFFYDSLQGHFFIFLSALLLTSDTDKIS